MNMPILKSTPTLEKFRTMIKTSICRWCKTDLKDQVLRIQRSGIGYKLEKRQGLWRIYIKCPTCHYEWDLAKLGGPKPLIEQTHSIYKGKKNSL